VKFVISAIYAAALLCQAVPSSAQQWQSGGTNIYNANTGNVGIGTASPEAKFHLFGGEGRFDGYRTFFRHPDAQIRLGNFSANGTWAIGINGDVTDDLIVWNFKNGMVPLRFASGTNNASFWGNVGIGTASPATRLHVIGDVTVTGNIAAKYQDVAEWVPATRPILPGTVVVLDREQSNRVIPSTHAYDTAVAGVVSQNPGLLLGERGEGKVMVATTGRVKVRVDATRGSICVGDLLVTSGTEGLAMRSEAVSIGGLSLHRPGTLVGKALEPLREGQGEILVLLSLQ
jgi:hypothetical protein